MFRNRFTARKPVRRARLGVQQLEAREVPAVNLLSALAVGSATGDSVASDVAADAAGNSYMVGRFSGTADFDPGPGTYLLTARGTADAYVAKYAPDGALVWAKRMGGDAVVTTDPANYDGASAVAVDGNGNVVVAGRFYGSADFGGTTLTSAGGRDAFVTKFGPTGQTLWAKRWGAANNDEFGFGVGTDAAGNVYALGDRKSTNLAINGDDVHKFSPTGTLLWTRSVNITGGGRAVADGDLAVDPAGNVYVVDTFVGLVDFDPGAKTKLVTSSTNQGFVLKLTTGGAYGWVSTFRGVSSGSDLSRSLNAALGGDGSIYVGGTYVGAVDFDPGAGTVTLPSSGSFAGFVVKLSASAGSFAWVRALQGSFPDVAADAAGSVYATGSGGFVAKLTAGGTVAWVETFGGTTTGSAIAVDPSGTVHLAGSFSATVDFDPDPLGTYDLTSPGPYRSSFLVRLRSS